MPGAFWDSWQLWEKMCFVLGASIVVVIFLGCLKLIFNHWRLRKYTAIAASKAAVRQEMQHVPSVRRGRAQAIPFGVRAIESGIEVDGVWVSGTNTPIDTSRSPALTAISDKLKEPQSQTRSTDGSSSSSNMSRLEIPQPTHGYRGGNPYAATGPRAASVERSSYLPPSIFAEQHARVRDAYQPRRSSGLRYSNADGEEYAAAMAALESHQQVVDREGQGSADSEEDSDGHPRCFSWAGSSSSEELGKPAVHAPSPSRGSLPHSPYEVSPVYSEDSNPFLTPVRTSADQVVNDHRIEGTDDATTYHSQMMQNADIEYDHDHAHPVRPFEPCRESQVIRKINSGFQILRPGTLDQPRQSSDDPDFTRATDSGNKRTSRKLQRKRGDSAASRSTVGK